MDRLCRFNMIVSLKENPRAVLGPGQAELLSLVDEYSSLRKAAAKMGMSYSKAWRIIKEAEQGFGFDFLESTAGGASGGGSKVTEKALKLTMAFTAMDKDLHEYAEKIYGEYIDPVVSVGG